MHEHHMTPGGFAAMLATHGVDIYKPDRWGSDKPSIRISNYTRRDTMIANPDGGPAIPMPKERGKQISDYLASRKSLCRYVVIDDGGWTGKKPDGEWCDMGIHAAGHPVVWTQSEIGLTEDAADRVIALLNH